jgi:hypothetical protein
MNAFHVRKIEKRTYVRRVKVVKSNHGHYESDNMKIHLQMGDDDMPSAINEATPRLAEFIAVLNKGREFGPCFSELTVSETRSFEEQTSTERRMGTGTSLQVLSILIMSVYTRQITDAANLNSMTCITGSVIFEV